MRLLIRKVCNYEKDGVSKPLRLTTTDNLD